MLKREHFEFRETAVTIITDDAFMGIVKNAIFDARAIIESKIMDDPFFGSTYDPYVASKGDADLIRRMCTASQKAEVGPMASVAGAVATYAVEKAAEHGVKHIIIENGGDIAMMTEHDTIIGLYAGHEETEGISVKVGKSEEITGICSSSGRVGPSVSFGDSDICTVFSSDVILADAAATRLGNLIRDGSNMVKALEVLIEIDGIEGCIAFCEGNVATIGNIPELVIGKISNDLITKREQPI